MHARAFSPFGRACEKRSDRGIEVLFGAKTSAPLRNLNRCLGRHLNLSGMEGVNGDALTKSKAKKRTNLELTMKIKNEMKMKRTK